MNNKQGIIILLVAILVAGGLLMLPKEKPSKYKNLDEFAKCLTENAGTTMYGAYWCGHCKNEKAAFGKAFEFVNYVECTENSKLCTDEGVKAYPTWKFKNGKVFEGEMGLENLAKESSCVLEPKEE
jgi:hypothetical protein